MSTLTQEAVLNALRTVQDPDLHRDLVSLNMIRDLVVGADGAVSLRAVLTTPACPMKAKIEADIRAAVTKVPGVTSLNVKMDAEVRAKATTSNRVPGVTHVIAVSSGKGGVGKSTVAVNLACALKAEGARVGILDADIYGPNVPTMMGVIGEPRIEKQESGTEMFIPPRSHEIPVMSMGLLIPADQPVVWRGPMLNSAVQQFLFQVKWGELDYLVVDMPPGTGDVQLSLAQLVQVTGAVMVSTPQEVSMQDVRKAFAMFEKVRVPVLGVVENMSYFRCDSCEKKHSLFGTGGGEKLAKKFGTRLLAEIPIKQGIREGGDEGMPIVLGNPESEIAKTFRDLARSVAQEVSIVSNQQTAPSQIVQIGKFN